jgi:hypothetical protein
MAESTCKRRIWGKVASLGMMTAVVPIAAAMVVPLSAAYAAPAGAKAPANAGIVPISAAYEAPTGVEAPAKAERLTVIMHPAGHPPVGTDCRKAKLFGLKKDTIRAAIFCGRTTAKNIGVWGYQFKAPKSYIAGLRHIDSFTGFDKIKHLSGSCPPAKGRNGGIVGWHALHNKKYKSRKGQFLECFKDKKPLLIWTMPTQNVFFIAKDVAKKATINAVIKWWETVSYG